MARRIQHTSLPEGTYSTVRLALNLPWLELSKARDEWRLEGRRMNVGDRILNFDDDAIYELDASLVPDEDGGYLRWVQIDGTHSAGDLLVVLEGMNTGSIFIYYDNESWVKIGENISADDEMDQIQMRIDEMNQMHDEIDEFPFPDYDYLEPSRFSIPPVVPMQSSSQPVEVVGGHKFIDPRTQTVCAECNGSGLIYSQYDQGNIYCVLCRGKGYLGISQVPDKPQLPPSDPVHKPGQVRLE